MDEIDRIVADLPEKPEGWGRRMSLHMNFGSEGGMGHYDVFDADGRKMPFSWGYDTREGGGKGFRVPGCKGWLTWAELREHYRARLQETDHG